MNLLIRLFFSFLVAGLLASSAAAEVLELTGERRCWHKLTLSLKGPEAAEADGSPNPFLDYRLTVTFRHDKSGETYAVPGYFAADGDAGESGAGSGNVWRAHFSPSKPGAWSYEVSFVEGEQVAIAPDIPGKPLGRLDGIEGQFLVEPTDKSGRDFRGKGRLQYVGERYLRFAETGEPFFKAGPDSPETLLGYADFDGTTTRKTPLKTWGPHIQDWREGDPVWRGDKGRGLIGALNYIASKGMNSISFIPYNAGGDGDNVWPMIARDKTLHYDCSKLDQWQVVFDHAQRNGLFLHFKLQETENDDNRLRNKNKESEANVPTALDGGDLGVERKLYLREMVARFGYQLALNWNLGEENTQSVEQQRAMTHYLRSLDPYDHLVVLHTYPDQQDQRYPAHVGDKTTLTGVSLQNQWDHAHRRTLQWVRASAEAGHPWVVCNDEQGEAGIGVPPDSDYQAAEGRNANTKARFTQDDVRKRTLWGTLMAGGAGVEYYFGYKLAENDLLCEDWRSRDAAWDDCRVAIEFFSSCEFPLVEMRGADQLVKNGPKKAYCLAKPGEAYLIYLLSGGASKLDLTGVDGEYSVEWFNPREGGSPTPGPVASVAGGGLVELGAAPSEEDWVAIVRKKP